jgi:hypothetical protein
MLIRCLRIINQVDDYELRTVKFHSGANFIVDTDDSKQHNKVGKTTFLKLIDVALGARDRRLIYFDSETNSLEGNLEKYIRSNKSMVELTLVDNLSNPKTTHILKVGLYKNSPYFIDGKRLKQNDYREKLNLFLFDNDKNTPRFRQLIHSFVRISMSGDTNTFLRNIPSGTKSDYRSVYNFLFNISDPSLDQERGKIIKSLAAVKEAMKQFSQIQNSQSSTQTMQVISSLRNEQKRLIHELDDIVSQDTFEKNRQKLTEARTEYTNLADQIAILEYRLRINKKLILDTQKDANQATNNDLTKDFFKEMKTLLPNISKSFNELVTFNKQLFLNKIKYIEQLNADLKSRIKLLKDRQDRLTKNNQDLLSLVATDKLDEYTELSAQLAKRNQEIIQQEQLLLSLNKFEKKKDSLESQLTLLNRKSNETNSVFPKKIEQFNIFFTRFAEKINGERPMLTYNPDVNQFPLAIKDLNGTSTGTRKSLIAAYDFAYQKFAKSENKQIPNFVVHDVMENIEGVNLKTTINIANETGTQYIVALLKEKLDSSGFSKEDQSKYELIKLSSSNRIFDDHRKYRPHVQ